MKTIYQEQRQLQKAAGSLATDLTKHLQRRQHLGTAVVLCEQPQALMPVVRKQWLKIARNLQRERAATVNAQRILQLTYATTRMHHLNFVAKPPHQYPEGDVFFVTPGVIKNLPERCYSLYITTAMPIELAALLRDELADKATIFDYVEATSQLHPPLEPKAALGEIVREQWRHVQEFLHDQHVEVNAIAQQSARRPALLDDAIDILLNHSQDFLRIASNFQHCLQLAQPLEDSHETLQHYSMLTLLAHRVQTLSTGELTQYLDSVGDNTFFLRDSAAEADEQQQLEDLLEYHTSAGHKNILAALRNTQSAPA